MWGKTSTWAKDMCTVTSQSTLMYTASMGFRKEAVSMLKLMSLIKVLFSREQTG